MLRNRRRARIATTVSPSSTPQKKRLELTIEVRSRTWRRIGQAEDIPSGPASQGPVRTTIWTAIHPRLLELIRAHRSTLIFVNSRRLAERLASALNELAGETLVRSHHGSLARPQRIEVEDRLKAGLIRGLVATSSLELGIDMGAIDLVIQIEAPPSVASGMQRIGRSGHTIDAASRGVIFPKFRGDLVACAAVTRAMHEAQIESHPLPAQPARRPRAADRRDGVDGPVGRSTRSSTPCGSAAPFAELGRSVFEGVLDMLSGRYPSDDFADLRPRLTWDRLQNIVTAREGAKRVAVINGGTIPDRGLYGVFLAGERGPGARVGELDEEMVFESRVGETFLLGASSWRIEEITPRPRARVSPAPGEPGKMPFWKADAAGRPLELGRAVGALVRTLVADAAGSRAFERLVAPPRSRRRRRPRTCCAISRIRSKAAGVVPDDRTVVVERCRDELGDWRICVLSPFGGRIHAPWAMAVVERARAETGLDVETMWTDDGFVVRFPETDEPPDPQLMVPAVRRSRGAGAAAARRHGDVRREVPRGRRPRAAPAEAPAGRTQPALAAAQARGRSARRRVAVRLVPDRARGLSRVPARRLRHAGARRHAAAGSSAARSASATVDSTIASPFAASLLFGYVANYLYDGDAPLAERRAQALSIDQAQLRELLGEAELRELLDADAIADVESELQHLDDDRRARTRRRRARSAAAPRRSDRRRDRRAQPHVDAAPRSRRTGARAAGDRRDASPASRGSSRSSTPSRYRDALGVPLPTGLPEALLEPAPHAALDLARRYARTHAPFTTAEFAARYGLGRVDRRGAAEGARRRAAACSKESSGRAAPDASGATRTSCRRFAAARSRSCGIRSNRSSPRSSGGW